MFGIGDQTVPLPMPADGRLFLGVNDDFLQDNQGQFRVQVRPVQPRALKRSHDRAASAPSGTVPGGALSCTALSGVPAVQL